MDRALTPSPPPVIEVVVEVTTYYDVTFLVRREEPSVQDAPSPKQRPVATVRPFVREDETHTEEEEEEGKHSSPDSSFLEDAEKDTFVCEYQEEKEETLGESNLKDSDATTSEVKSHEQESDDHKTLISPCESPEQEQVSLAAEAAAPSHLGASAVATAEAVAAVATTSEAIKVAATETEEVAPSSTAEAEDPVAATEAAPTAPSTTPPAGAAGQAARDPCACHRVRAQAAASAKRNKAPPVRTSGQPARSPCGCHRERLRAAATANCKRAPPPAVSRQVAKNLCGCHRDRVRAAAAAKPNRAPPVRATDHPARDLCACHRDRVRAAAAAKLNKTMEECLNQNGVECADDNCMKDVDVNGHIKEKGTSLMEKSCTECLDEFLEELQLTHLGNYLRVLGCTCVRDLRLLEEPELNAVQLISRRRLLKRLDAMEFHDEAPPEDCSLEAWLTWYGLTHISGFLVAIGVHSVGDLCYLKEEDLELLKPVTRRRILSCYRKI